jgi:hypothetical protein
MIDRALLPVTLTDEERRGFRMACACLATWGYRLAAEPSLGGSPDADEVRARFRKHGRVAAAMASALDRMIGQPRPVADVPVEALVEIATADPPGPAHAYGPGH